MKVKKPKKRAASRPRAATKSKRPLPWDADSAGRSGPTSQDVLMHWLQTPGKYHRWHQGKRRRTEAALEILKTLEMNGLAVRTLGAVNSKIKTLVQQYLAAVKMLEEEGLTSDYLTGDDVDEALARVVLKECPHFQVLQPILRGFDFTDVAPKDRASGDDSADSDYVEEPLTQEAARGGGPPSKRHRSSADQDGSGAQETTGYACAGQAASKPSSCTDLVPVHDASGAEFRRNVEECKLQFLQKTTHRMLQTDRAMEECDVAVKRCQVEAAQFRTKVEQIRAEDEAHRAKVERRRREMLSTVDTMLSRQTLKARRVNRAEIDAVLPLPTAHRGEN